MQTPQNMGRSEASKLKHRFIYALIYVGGRQLAYAFLYLLVFVYTCIPAIRRKSTAYITHRFGPCSYWKLWQHTYRLNLTFGRTLVDRAALGILGSSEVRSTPQEQALCTRLLKEGHGLILLTAHAGCWQSAVNLFEFLPGKKNLLYYRNPYDNDKTVSQHQGKQAPFTRIDPAGPLGGMVEMLAALQRGETLCAMADRVFGSTKNTVAVQFLGGTVRLPYSFYRLSAVSGAPIVILFFPWIKRGTFASHTAAILRVADLGASAEPYKVYAQQFVDELAKFCIKYPYQFFNYFNMWENEYAAND